MTAHLVLRRGAFSLIELLVAIAIIAVLVGIALPVLGRSREAARMVQCQANLIQMSLITRNHATDSNDRLPEFVPIFSPPGNPSIIMVKLTGNPTGAKPGMALFASGVRGFS